MSGVSSITAWLTQASDRAKSGRDITVSVTTRMFFEFRVTRWCNWQHMAFWWPYSRFESWSGSFCCLLFIIDYLEKKEDYFANGGVPGYTMLYLKRFYG